MTPDTPPTPDPNRWMSVSAYAKACGLTRDTAILSRITRKTLPATEQVLLDGSVMLFIDAVANPPERRTGGRGLKKPPRRAPYTGPN